MNYLCSLIIMLVNSSWDSLPSPSWSFLGDTIKFIRRQNSVDVISCNNQSFRFSKCLFERDFLFFHDLVYSFRFSNDVANFSHLRCYFLLVPGDHYYFDASYSQFLYCLGDAFLRRVLQRYHAKKDLLIIIKVWGADFDISFNIFSNEFHLGKSYDCLPLISKLLNSSLKCSMIVLFL